MVGHTFGKTAAQNCPSRPPESGVSTWPVQAKMGPLWQDRDLSAIAVKSDPGNAERQRDLAVIHSELAMVLMRRGDKAKAAGYLRHGQAQEAHLVAEPPPEDMAGQTRPLPHAGEAAPGQRGQKR
jgi:hypothetical protein